LIDSTTSSPAAAAPAASWRAASSPNTAPVLLLEAGPAKPSRLLGMPAGYMKYLARDTFLTMHKSVPQPQLDGRAPIIPQANSWRRQRRQRHGLHPRPGGRLRQVGPLARPGLRLELSGHAPHFKRQEDNDHLGGEYHGTSGP
jgi:choline dehydrogenase